MIKHVELTCKKIKKKLKITKKIREQKITKVM